jgi:two-component system NtrC family response regulator
MGKTILIVDDDDTNRELIREAIADFECEIREASSASAALEHFRYCETALVITDVCMPGMSGVDLLEKVRDNYPETVVILVSAHATIAKAVEAMRMGAYHYLTLPIDIDALRAVVLRALECQKLRACARFFRGGDQSRPSGFEETLGNSKDLVDVLAQASRAARSNGAVLIAGESGTGTADANERLGFKADCRDYALPVEVLKALGIVRVRLISNNPDKVRALERAGIRVVERVPCEVDAPPFARHYLETKRERCGHLFASTFADIPEVA